MNSIYKYMPYREAYLDNFNLKLSLFGEFNDPFEMVMGNYFSSLPQDEYEQAIKHSSFHNDAANYIDAYWNVQSGARASTGVICFTRKPDNLLMWAHYAVNHRGICVEFDRNAPHFTGKYKNASKSIFTDELRPDYYQNIGVLRDVDYQIERPSYIDPNELEYDTDSWFVKSPDWKYEEELRMLVSLDIASTKEVDSDNVSPTMHFIDIPPPYLKSVILGCQMKPEEKQQIVDRCQSRNIKVKECFIHPHRFELVIVDFDIGNHSRFLNEFNLNRITS